MTEGELSILKRRAKGMLLALVISFSVAILVGVLVSKRRMLDVAANIYSSIADCYIFMMALFAINDELLYGDGFGLIKVVGESVATYALFGASVLFTIACFAVLQFVVKIAYAVKVFLHS